MALTGLKTFEGLWLKHMPWLRLNQINKKVMIKLRIEEQKRLLRLQEKLNLYYEKILICKYKKQKAKTNKTKQKVIKKIPPA